MKVLSAAGQLAIAASTVNLVHLIKFYFDEPLCLNTSNLDFEFNGDFYRRAYGLGNISTIEDSPGEIKGIQFSLAGNSAELIALALDDAAIWQSTKIEIRHAVLSDSYQILDAPLAWSGRGDTMSLSEDAGECLIQATAESSAVDLIRSSVLSYNDADQQMLYPGDLGFSLTAAQVNKPVVWPAKEWFHK